MFSVISDNYTRSQAAKNSRNTLLKYCLCAWGLPAVVIAVCFALDYMDTLSIGYGNIVNRQIKLPHVQEYSR